MQNKDKEIVLDYYEGDDKSYGAGTSVAAAQAAMHLPKAALHATMAGAVATPAVTVPKTAPAAP